MWSETTEKLSQLFMVQRIMGEQLPLFLVKHLKFLSFLAEFE